MADPDQPARRRRIPAFTPVPTRARADGWSPQRQAAFIAALAVTQRVDQAARAVGMSRQSAYRLRDKAGADSFAAAWDAILLHYGQMPPRKVTHDELVQRVTNGLMRPVVHRGRHVLTHWHNDGKALLILIRQYARANPKQPGGRLG